MEVVKMFPKAKTCVNTIFDANGHHRCGEPVVEGFLVCKNCKKMLEADKYTVPVDSDFQKLSEEVKTHPDN